MSAHMRAKVRVSSVVDGIAGGDDDATKYGEKLTFDAVAASTYPEDGTDENNTFAKYSPSATFTIDCRNPNLFGKFEVGEEYYVDFIPVGVPQDDDTDK